MPTLSTFGALVALALRLCAKRWWFYTLAVLVTIGLQTAVLTIHVLHDPLQIAGTIIPPILVLVVYVFVATDATGEEVARGARWERVLERSWAVILIDLAIEQIVPYALGGGNDATGFLVGMIAYGLIVLTIYADVNAALEPNVRTLMIVPRAFQRSAMLAFNRANISLTLFLAVATIATLLLELYCGQWLVVSHVPHAAYWFAVPLQAVIAVPYSALVAVVYLECVAREKTAAGAGR